ncbi:MAG: glycerate kinase [Jatrophihabitantaceae bacterium]
MRVLLAVDKFKGSLDSVCAAEALSAGIQSVRAHAEVRIIPVADGGDGTVDVALTAGFTRIPTNAPGPTGLQLATSYARKGDSVIIELASVCGLQRLPIGRLEPWKSSTYGLGVLICHAVDHGARTIVVGVGGSASTDGGTGLLQALGARLNDSSNHPVRSGAIGLGDLCAVDLGPVHERLAGVELVIASDVDNPLLGPNGAAAAYGPQKGASWRDVIAMNQLLADWSAAVRSEFGIELSTQLSLGRARPEAQGSVCSWQGLACRPAPICCLISSDTTSC